MRPGAVARVEMVGRRYPHHAARSGYDQLAARLDIPLQWHAEPERVRHTAGFRYINGWYTYHDALQEVRAALAIRRSAPQVVHFLYGDNGYRNAARLCRAKGTKWVATFHQPSSMLPKFGVDREVIRELDAVVLMGEAQRAYFEANGARTVYVIPHGVDCGYFSPVQGQAREPFQVVTVGHWLRDFQLYFQVVMAALQAGAPLHFRLVTNVAIPTALVPRNCTILSAVRDETLLEEYRRAACCYLPLRDTTANNALLEAMACGLPLVVSDVGCVRDYVDESAAVLLKDRNPDAHLSALLEVAALGKVHEARSRAARNLAEQREWSQIAPRYRDMYGAIAG